jgi:methionyl-tRNA synthetase
MITIDDFKKVELRVATIREAERVEGSDKLIRLQVDLSEANLPASRQVLAGIGKVYEPEQLVGKQIIIVANLEPRSLMGQESNGMLLAASGQDGPVIISPIAEVPNGSEIR